MLKHRTIPVLLTDGNGQCVKPIAFGRPYRKLGTMEQYIQIIERRNVDELIIIDIEATAQGRKPNFAKLRSWCDNLFCPVTYGGGISTLDHIRLALENGADKVAIKSAYNIIPEASNKFGKQAIVGVIDSFDEYDEYYYGWSASRYFEKLGVGEILLNDQNSDGKMKGYNIELIKQAKGVLIPTVILGGCGEPVHMHQALAAGASAVAAGSMFLFTEHTPRSCAEFLNEMGHPVRL